MPRLDIDFYANVARLQQDMAKGVGIVDKGMKDMRRAADTLKGVFATLGVGIGVAELVRFSKSVIDTGDQLYKLSQRTGVSVEDLSTFTHGAKLAGLSTEELSDALRKLAKNMSEAGSDEASSAANAFRAIGVSVTDATGKLRSSGEVFREIAAQFEGYKDGPQKAALAMAIFGKSGDSLIPLLNTLRETSEEARQLGLVVSTEFARNAEAFNDNITRMAQVIRASAIPVLNEMAFAVRDLFGDESMDVLERRRAELANQYVRLIDAGVNRNTQAVKDILKLIDETDEKIIALSKKLSAARPIGDKVDAPSFKEGKDQGLVSNKTEDSFRQMLARLELDAKRFNANLIDDSRDRSLEMIQIDTEEWRRRIEILNFSGEQQAALIAALGKRTEAAREDAVKRADAEARKIADRNAELVKDFGLHVASNREELNFGLDLLGKSQTEQEKMIALRQIEIDLVRALNVASISNDPDKDKTIRDLIEIAETEKRLLADRIDVYQKAATSFDVGMQTALRKLIQDSENTARQVEGVMTNAFSNMENAIVQFARTGKFEFRAFAASVIEDLLRMQIQASISGPLSKWLAGLFAYDTSHLDFATGGTFSTRAHGGPVSGGSTYLVGEQGPEIFVPNTSGTIIPNGATIAGGSGPVIYADLRGADRTEFERLKIFVARLNGSIEERSVSATLNARRRSSSYASAFGA